MLLGIVQVHPGIVVECRTGFTDTLQEVDVQRDIAGSGLAAQPVPDRRAAGVPRAVAMRRCEPDTCLLVSPYGQAGGGMGRAMTYLMAAGSVLSEAERGPGAPHPLRLLAAESRGQGHAAASPLHAGRVALRMLELRLAGRLALVHLNVAERGSIWRKGVLLAWARLLGVPVLLHLHAAQVIAFHAGLGPVRRRLVGAMFRQASRVVVLGGPWRDWVAGLGVPASRIAVVRNGVPRPVAAPTRRPAGLPFRLLFLGNLSARKGVPELLDALASPALAGVAVHLTLAGGGAAAFRERVAALGLEPRVTFTGWLDAQAVAACLAAADALVLPSHDEGLPLVILEALGLGLPVVTTPVGAIPEVLREGETALLVPPGDATALAAALARLVGDEGLRERLGAAGRALYEREFTLARFSARMREEQLACLAG